MADFSSPFGEASGKSVGEGRHCGMERRTPTSLEGTGRAGWRPPLWRCADVRYFNFYFFLRKNSKLNICECVNFFDFRNVNWIFVNLWIFLIAESPRGKDDGKGGLCSGKSLWRGSTVKFFYNITWGIFGKSVEKGNGTSVALGKWDIRSIGE